MKKVTHKQTILCALGVTAGSLVAASGVGALTYQSEVSPEFTWNPSLTVTLSSTDMTITDLVPGGAAKDSDPITVTVNTNSVAGYVLSARMNTATNTLNGTTGNTISMVTSDSASLDGDRSQWGLKNSNDGSTWSNYRKLNTSAGEYISIRTYGELPATDAAKNTQFKIGAKATEDQVADTYTNTINFSAVSSVLTRNVTVATGDNVTSVSISDGSSATTGTYAEGAAPTITATCNSGYTFGGWIKSAEYGVVAAQTASTTYTVGHGDVTLTAYCVSE